MFAGNRSQSPGERSAEERERARAERERRRAQASGAAAPRGQDMQADSPQAPGGHAQAPGGQAQAPSGQDQSLELPDAGPQPQVENPVETEPRLRVEDLVETELQPPTVEYRVEFDGPPLREDAVEMERSLEGKRSPRGVERSLEGKRSPRGVEQSLEGKRSLPGAERPIEVELPPPADMPARIVPPPGLAAHRRSRGRPVRRASGGRLTRARVGALVALVAAAVLVWLLVSVFQPFAGAPGGSVIVDIPKGSSSSAIGSILARDGVVSSGFFFELRALLEGKRGDLHSGRFQMRRGMSYAAAIAALSQPPPARITVRVVIPEGETAPQIARIAAAEDLTGSYLAESRRSRLLDPARYGAPGGTPDLEGFLFPATYELYAGTPVSNLVAEQLTAFKQNFGLAEIQRAHVLGVTPYQLLTVASMVEREALLAHDRPLVAAVIYNRRRQGMALGIDATIRYALNDYTHPLTEAQLRLDSPYNTRIHHGLPPTPISNPGMASIEAAAHPAHVPYLYYVDGADGCGELVFSTSYAQFERDAAAYRAALSRNDGRVPTCRKR